MYPAREAGNFGHRAKPAAVPGFGEAEAGEVRLVTALCQSVEQQEGHAQVPQQRLEFGLTFAAQKEDDSSFSFTFQMSCTVFCALNSPVLGKGIPGNLLKVTKYEPDTLDHTLYLDLFPTLYILFNCRKFEMRCTVFAHWIVECYYRTFFFSHLFNSFSSQ